MTEIYKTKCSLNPPFMKNIFLQRSISFRLRHSNDAELPEVRTTSFGIELITYLGNKLWQHLPQEIYQADSLPVVKKQVKRWNGENATVGFAKCMARKLGFQQDRFLTLSCPVIFVNIVLL